MSLEEQSVKDLHVLLGIYIKDEEKSLFLRKLNEEFEKRGNKIGICVSKFSKLSIEQYLSENKDTDVVIISEHLQQSSPYKPEDYEKLTDICSSAIIIPILEKEKRGSAYVNQLLSVGIYTALFEDNTYPSAITEMVFEGRSRKDARYYYGADGTQEVNDTVDIPACINHIISGIEKDNIKEKADYIRNKVTENDFSMVIARLPKEAKDRLRVYDDYSMYFAGTAGSGGDKKVIFHSILSRFTQQEDSTEQVVPTIVKQEVQSAVKKAVIGFAGSQQRVGTSHQTILFANYLTAAGYKIAVVESDTCINKSFMTFEQTYKVKYTGDYFSYQDVDYYPNYSLNELNRIFLRDYNFVLIDFGMFTENIAMEFGRCIVQIIITGSKVWEFPYLEQLMMLVNDEDVLKKYNYLFMFTPENDKSTIRKNMAALDKVFFAEYQADPFINTGYEAIRDILEDYLPGGANTSGRGRLVNKLKKLFE